MGKRAGGPFYDPHCASANAAFLLIGNSIAAFEANAAVLNSYQSNRQPPQLGAPTLTRYINITDRNLLFPESNHARLARASGWGFNHNLVLGFDHSELLRLYEQAQENGSYEKVERRNREPQKACAITNHKEYFAECTDDYFGEKDFYPFNNTDLKEHDPDMFDLLTDIWIRAND